jgi:hypothetical protein
MSDDTTLEVDRRLAEVDVPETRFRADMELHGRSLELSSELLKLGLGGIAVVGFALGAAPGLLVQRLFEAPYQKQLVSLSIVAFALAVGCALLHRFFASGASFHHLQVIKLVLLNDRSLNDAVAANMRHRTRKFMVCHRWLQGAAMCLVLAASALAAAFIRMLLR